MAIIRMLDVVNANMDAAMATADEDIAALRNAVHGVRLEDAIRPHLEAVR